MDNTNLGEKNIKVEKEKKPRKELSAEDKAKRIENLRKGREIAHAKRRELEAKAKKEKESSHLLEKDKSKESPTIQSTKIDNIHLLEKDKSKGVSGESPRKEDEVTKTENKIKKEKKKKIIYEEESSSSEEEIIVRRKKKPIKKVIVQEPPPPPPPRPPPPPPPRPQVDIEAERQKKIKELQAKQILMKKQQQKNKFMHSIFGD